jgi:ribosomal protein S18 acetylase RimI-like enzyme
MNSPLPNAGTTTATSASTAAQPEAMGRRFAKLMRSGLIAGDLKGCTIERACRAADLKQAYRIVYEVFQQSGFLKPEPSGIRLRMFETSAETATFVAKQGDEIVGVLSIVPDSATLGLPSDEAFKSELDGLRTKGGRLFEITNQAVVEGYRRSGVATELMRCAIAHAIQAGYDCGIASVSPSHRGFYGMIGFEVIGSERSYSDKLHDPVIALSMNLAPYRQPAAGRETIADFIHHLLTEGNRFQRTVRAWDVQARQMFLNAALLIELFVTGRDFLSECSPDEREQLKAHWGKELFAVVMALHVVFTTPGRSAALRPYQRAAGSRAGRSLRRSPQPGLPAFLGFARSDAETRGGQPADDAAALAVQTRSELSGRSAGPALARSLRVLCAPILA